ncbi:MAG: nicotinamide mononucleotide transporter [Pseudomonadales bacterium]|nr:nicotinamide mononucleotide transporter [Pseudomonadales bacterium]MBO6702386.1 nicotinamide mononucleotide transporter [Pseudomonadales bacterium]MBO7007614.1 nicotinamide mononucleotide transporter [Pseudomonadales bacterium]
MNEALTTAFTQLQQSSLLELTAVILAVIYLVLAVKQNIACWYAAFISTAIFLHIFWQANLYMESGLQVFYLGMAVYGWFQWRTVQGKESPLPVSTWPPRYHLAAFTFIGIATFISGTLLADTDQRLGYVDSFTTWGAIVTTFMVARKILENWIYWLVIDSVSIYLYLDRALYFTAILFMAYLVIIFFGFRAWWLDYRSFR